MGEPAEKKIDRRVRRTRAAIQSALKEMLATTPLDKVTVTSLARQADINRKTFYLHYSSVEEVMDDLLNQEAEKLVSMMVTDPSAGGDASAENILRLFSMASAQGSLLKGEAVDSGSMDDLLTRIEKPLVKAIIEHDTLGLADKAGDNLGYAVTFYCAGLIAVFRRWLRTGSKLSLEELTQVTAGVMNVVALPQRIKQ